MIYGNELVRMFSDYEDYYVQKQFDENDGLGLGTVMLGGAAALGGGFLAAKKGYFGKGAKKWSNDLFKSGTKAEAAVANKAEDTVAGKGSVANNSSNITKPSKYETNLGSTNASGIRTNTTEGEKLEGLIKNGGSKEEIDKATKDYVARASDGHGSMRDAKEQIRATQVKMRNEGYSARWNALSGTAEGKSEMNRLREDFFKTHKGPNVGEQWQEFMRTYSSYRHYKYRFL